MQSEEKLSLNLIIDTVTKHMGVTVEDLKSSSRKSKVVHARSIVTYAAVRGSGYKGSEVAEGLSLSRPGRVLERIDEGIRKMDEGFRRMDEGNRRTQEMILELGKLIAKS